MQVFGLVGNPVGHSLSPPMHEAAYDRVDMDARYVTFEPSPEDLSAAVEGAEALGIAGLNVTIPFKREMVDLVEPDELAARIGAVNTVGFGDGPPRGYNTDAAGVRRSFAHHDVPLDGRSAVVVGAGGAGRAASFALADAGASVHVANRTTERATSLAADVPGATGGGLDTLDGLADADLLVNATSVGMESDETPVPAERLHDGLAVLDAVYAPVETRLLREAAAAGATTIDGAWMLLFQGVEAFERWTGRDAPVDAMNDALRANLG
ncbi:shikimate 5-dehydrogenase [Halogeometricum pallidum JCM 14848]|uniref:Shikimate dehydrogenase (NADP(+)) n=1 Tax=Halogeometricum pallidum JCM 14848 TaxID=1227487 RepID=M0CXK1_HALPD|nr:shikimate dehydrogenase [Halogeometricum pallidum]ELZ27167.1 shikimate 5-dehydrogenase [Halogeometricum pallidum JCM 14848]